MSQLIYQMKQAWAGLSKKPGFVATVVTTMGTTLGALLCILTLAYLLLFKPLPYPEQERLYKVEHAIADATGEVNARAYTYPGLIHLYENQDIFETTALVNYNEDVLTSQPAQPRLNVGYVTPEWFNMLDAKPLMGRIFEQTEALDTNNPVALLSHQLWQTEFANDPDIVGRKVDFSGISFSIVGVLSPEFVDPQLAQTGRNVNIWLPWDYNQDIRLKERWTNISGSLNLVGKLKNNLTVSTAQQTITPLVNDTWQENVTGIDFFSGWSIMMELNSFQSVILGESGGTVFMLFVGVLGLVIIAFANIANLFMSRTAEQQRQLAIFAALGAKKSHLFKAIFSETSLLMIVSVLLAMVVSAFGFFALQENLSDILPRVSELSINGVTVSAAAFLAFFFAALFAALNSKMINYRSLNQTLQSSGKGTGVQVSKGIRQVLIVSQVAIATALVFVNISLLKQAVDTINEPTGFNVDNMHYLSLSYSAPQFPPAEERVPVMNEIRQKLSELPQVESIMISGSPYSGFSLRALTSVNDGVHYTPRMKSVDHSYFSTIGQELIEGDYFTPEHVTDDARVMIVNDVFARTIAPTGSALGRQISSDPDSEPFVIVGVVKGVKMPGTSEVPIRVYIPGHPATNRMTLVTKPQQVVEKEVIVNILNEVDSRWAIFDYDNLVEIEKLRLFTQYTTAVTTTVLTIITLFLAGIGLYGILSYGTQMRRFELGTRMAIGAKKKHLVGMILKDYTPVVLFGILVSMIILVGVYIGYNDALASYVTLELLPAFIMTNLFIVLLSLFACYWPLRQYINRPAVHSLRGSD